MEIGEILKTFKLENKKRISERAEIIKDIYTIYTSSVQRVHRKKANWKRYIAWLKQNKIPDSKENQLKFKKSKNFIKEHDIKRFCFLISHLKEKDLYYVLSIAKDMENRNENFGAWIMSLRK